MQNFLRRDKFYFVPQKLFCRDSCGHRIYAILTQETAKL